MAPRAISITPSRAVLARSFSRGGEAATLGSEMPLVGDTCRAMQPQVSLTSGRAHTRAAPGDALIFTYLTRDSSLSHCASKVASLLTTAPPCGVVVLA